MNNFLAMVFYRIHTPPSMSLTYLSSSTSINISGIGQYRVSLSHFRYSWRTAIGDPLETQLYKVYNLVTIYIRIKWRTSSNWRKEHRTLSMLLMLHGCVIVIKLPSASPSKGRERLKNTVLTIWVIMLPPCGPILNFCFSQS